MEPALDYDVVVVGSGFGGSVAALRLTEKGYRVAVLEAGRRFDESSYPKTSWQLRSFFWAPKLGCFGLQRISLLKDVMILSGAGVGGVVSVLGSMVDMRFSCGRSTSALRHFTRFGVSVPEALTPQPPLPSLGEGESESLGKSF